MNQSIRNPFLDDVYISGSDRLPGVARIHHTALERIVDSIESLVSPAGEASSADLLGRLILVKAPRAGYGKSHFSARLEKRTTEIATTLTLPFDPSRPISWPVVFSSTIRQLGHADPTQPGAESLLDETSRFLFAQLTLAHRQEGSPLLEDCPLDDAQLRSRFASAFSPEDSSGGLAWIDQRGRELSYRASPVFQKTVGLRGSELGFWTRLLIDHQMRGEAALDSIRGLSNGEARERLLQLLRVHSFYRPVFLVADGLDGFFRSDSAGLEIANLLTGIRQSIPRSVCLLCLNDDIWESVFENQLPSALLDRLNGDSETLRAISPEAASELVRNRLEQITISSIQTDRFLDRLKHDHLWVDAETKLYPRGVLRQAKELWDQHAENFLTGPKGEEESDFPTSLEGLTDKADFFEALRNEKPPPQASIPDKKGSTSPPPALRDRPSQNPFFAPPTFPPGDKLAGIESIIADIRGTGKRVVSESRPPAVLEDNPVESIEAGEIHVRTIQRAQSPKSTEPRILLPEENEEVNSSASEKDIRLELQEAHEEIRKTSPLQLDLIKIGELLRVVGAAHKGLRQTEERFPSSQTPCLRWGVRGLSVLIGFETPQNVYFWNNLLQQSLSASQPEKISAFSHGSKEFDPGLFASFGFSPSVIQSQIDIIEMNDKELSMLYAADRILEKYQDRPESNTAKEVITFFLDPLWRRISRPMT